MAVCDTCTLTGIAREYCGDECDRSDQEWSAKVKHAQRRRDD